MLTLQERDQANDVMTTRDLLVFTLSYHFIKHPYNFEANASIDSFENCSVHDDKTVQLFFIHILNAVSKFRQW